MQTPTIICIPKRGRRDYFLIPPCPLVITRLKIQKDIHFLVKQADNIDHLSGNEIEHHMLAMRETVMTVRNFIPLSAGPWVQRQPFKALLQTLQIAIALLFTPL